MDINDAQNEIRSLEKDTALLHAQIVDLRREKTKLTRRISALYAFVDGMREPNLKGTETIGL